MIENSIKSEYLRVMRVIWETLCSLVQGWCNIVVGFCSSKIVLFRSDLKLCGLDAANSQAARIC